MNTPPQRSAAAATLAAAGLSLLALLPLTGCKVGPNYSRPAGEALTPAGFAEQAQPTMTSGITPGGAAGLAEAAWWSTMNDPILTSLVGRAAANNLDLRIAAERITEARAQRGIAAAAGLPTLDFQGDYSRSRQSENAFNGRFSNDRGSGHDDYSIGLNSGWEIDVFGGIARSVEAAEADIQTLEANRRDVMVMLAAEVARNYIDLRGFQQRIRVTEGNVQVQADTLGLSDSRFRAGLTSELDVAQAKAQLETTRANIPPLEEAAAAAMHRLAVLLGSNASEWPAVFAGLRESGPIPVAPADVAIGLPSELVQRRPDIQRAERQLAAQTARIGVATSDLFPKFSLSGNFGLESSQLGTIPQGDSRFWSIGPAIRWPLFQGGRIRANIQVQESLARQALSTYDQSLLIAFEDVENALMSFSRNQVRRASLSEAVVANRRAVDLSTQLYRAGLADFQRVLTSQLSLSLSEEQLVASDQAVMQALIRLYKALGGGWAAVP